MLILSASYSFAQVVSGSIPTDPAARCGATVEALSQHPVIRHVETDIVPALTGSVTRSQSLSERMRALNVPGVSVVMMRQGRIEWARGWGVRDAGTCVRVSPTTLFQAASISKSVTALLAMRLVEQGRLDLDKDVNVRLRRWKLPRDPRFPPAYVTLRQILSHTGGIGVHGFAGYVPGTPIPDLPGILDGQPPANNPAVRLEAIPGAGFSYSGGGYMIAQALIEDATGRSFADNAQEMILKPLGMIHSNFSQPLSTGKQANAASGHDGGNPFRDRFYIYPELAAAGLWTTPTDLAHLLIDVRAASKEAGHVVTPQTAATMLTPVAGNWGLGFSLWGEGLERRFGHGGVQLGFLSIAWINEVSGDGLVIMTNGENGLTLADDITRAVADELGWREFASRPLSTALATGPVYLRGSMNGWSTSATFSLDGANARSTTLSLRPGYYAFKIASEDWKTLVLGSENEDPIVNSIVNAPLVSGGSNITLKIAVAGSYRFTLADDGGGIAKLTVALIR